MMGYYVKVLAHPLLNTLEASFHESHARGHYYTQSKYISPQSVEITIGNILFFSTILSMLILMLLSMLFENPDSLLTVIVTVISMLLSMFCKTLESILTPLSMEQGRFP